MNYCCAAGTCSKCNPKKLPKTIHFDGKEWYEVPSPAVWDKARNRWVPLTIENEFGIESP